MALSSKSIVDLITAPNSSNGLNRGRLAHMGQKSAMGKDPLTRSQRTFVEAFGQIRTPERTSTSHPASGPLPRRQDGPLTPVEMAWLNRIPAGVDPATVSFEDAQALAAMDASIPLVEHPADSRLVRSVWHPVRDFHDQRAAEAAMSNAKQPLPSLPSSTLGALADAIAAETPQLTHEEAVGRASTMLAEATSKREATRQAALDAAHEQQMKVDARVLQRTVVAL